ncbi:hypothetical protein N7494_004198 [Penicillium frequentans]|uniref:Vegetative incompatibility protein HET-E-1 n=1 Tax=Penicillium frequentans TaxID=3151616 RepID=A0AAD6GIP8_9EURO|nr:hypothetical protein N7494_004198 [Penicillium glabrum]
MDHTVRLWDISPDALQHTLHGHSKWVSSVAFSPDGRLIASGSYGSVRLWDTATGALQQTLKRFWSGGLLSWRPTSNLELP